MKRIVILGAGSGGTMMANKLRKDLESDWSIVLIDRDNIHYYQPGFLLCPLILTSPVKYGGVAGSLLILALILLFPSWSMWIGRHRR